MTCCMFFFRGLLCNKFALSSKLISALIKFKVLKGDDRISGLAQGCMAITSICFIRINFKVILRNYLNPIREQSLWNCIKQGFIKVLEILHFYLRVNIFSMRVKKGRPIFGPYVLYRWKIF